MGHLERFLLFLFVTAVPGTLSAQVWWTNDPQLNCGPYTRVTYPNSAVSCQRYGVFPWYAAGAGWKSQIPVFLPPVPPIAGQTRGVLVKLSLGAGGNFTSFLGGPNGVYDYASGTQAIVGSAASVRFDIQNGAFCNTSCSANSGLAFGPLWFTIDAPDVASLQAASLQLIYLFGGDPAAFGNNTWQVAVPPIFNDQAVAKWMSSFSETPTELRFGNVNSSTMAFAVTNLSPQAQSVQVTLNDQYGHLLIEKTTPVLAAGAQIGTQVRPGGVFADTFLNFFGLSLNMLSDPDAAGDAQRTLTIDGTVMFRSANGQPIAPLAVRSSGRSNTVLLVTPTP